MNKAFEAAKRKGREAAERGEPRTACPYPDIRQNYHNGRTFSRAFQRYWHEGYDAAVKGNEHG